MNDLHGNNTGSKISKWENNFMNRHPVFHPIIMELVAELLVALVLAVLAFQMLPPELTYVVSKKTAYSCVLSITNEGFLFASGEYGIKTKKPLKEEPVMITGKKYVDSLERRSGNSFGLKLSGLPYKKEIMIGFKCDNIIVDEE